MRKENSHFFIECLNEPLVNISDKLLKLSQNPEVLALFYALALGIQKLMEKLNPWISYSFLLSVEDRLVRNDDNTVW